jgi:hypothetical protein
VAFRRWADAPAPSLEGAQGHHLTYEGDGISAFHRSYVKVLITVTGSRWGAHEPTGRPFGWALLASWTIH